jgi:hypothetical protein
VLRGIRVVVGVHLIHAEVKSTSGSDPLKPNEALWKQRLPWFGGFGGRGQRGLLVGHGRMGSQGALYYTRMKRGRFSGHRIRMPVCLCVGTDSLGWLFPC